MAKVSAGLVMCLKGRFYGQQKLGKMPLFRFHSQEGQFHRRSTAQAITRAIWKCLVSVIAVTCLCWPFVGVKIELFRLKRTT